MKWALTALAAGALAGPPSAQGIGLVTLIEILAGLVTILGGFFAWRKWQKLSAAQREDLEASAAQRAVEALDKALNQYVKDLERAKDELQTAKAAIARLETDLSTANGRIAVLEEALQTANGDRQLLQSRLDRAVAERAEIAVKLDQNQAAYHATQEKLAELERRVGGRRAADTQTPHHSP